MAHLNQDPCPGCIKVLNKYPNFHSKLRDWFNSFHSIHLDAHISWAGRGKADQELFYNRGLSHAHYGQSAHNYNAAIDFFRLTQAGGASFDSQWYRETLAPAVTANPDLLWYGAPGSKFYELPHVEWRNWLQEVQSGLLHLVDGPAAYPPPKSTLNTPSHT